MQTAKQAVQEMLESLPEDATLEDIEYHLYVLGKVQRGLQAVDEGRVLSEEEVERRLAKWLDA